MNSRYQSSIDASTEAIDQIDALLKQLTANLDQEKADHGKHDWAGVGTLQAVARLLDEANRFWTHGGVGK